MTQDLGAQAEEIHRSGILITPELLVRLRALLTRVFDLEHLSRAHQRICRRAGQSETAWLHRPTLPLILQAYNDCESWIAALKRNARPDNLGALGPFVRLGLSLEFAASCPGGQERIEELRRLAKARDFAQLANKAFELEVAYYFSQASARSDIVLGAIGGKPDLWVGPATSRIPVEVKAVVGGDRPSSSCRNEWKRFIATSVDEMRRRRVAVAMVVRVHDNFGAQIRDELQAASAEIVQELTGAADGAWALRSKAEHAFIVYGCRIGKWGSTQLPINVPLGLDGETVCWTKFVVGSEDRATVYIFSLKFQGIDSKIASVIENVRLAAAQLAETHPQGPGVICLKVSLQRAGDLYELERAIRDLLKRRSHVSSVVLLWDETAEVPDSFGQSPDARLFGFSLRAYVIANEHAAASLGWQDSRRKFFGTETRTLLRSPEGELQPFDVEAEEAALASGTNVDGDAGSPVLVRATAGNFPRPPYIVQETPELSASSGSLTSLFEFKEQIKESLLAIKEESVLLSWLVIGSMQLRIFRNRHGCIHVNRRTKQYQDNATIDLWPMSHATSLLLQLRWDSDGLTCSLRWSDEAPMAYCRSVRTSLG